MDGDEREVVMDVGLTQIIFQAIKTGSYSNVLFHDDDDNTDEGIIHMTEAGRLGEFVDDELVPSSDLELQSRFHSTLDSGICEDQ
ncbi:hypothetical protein EJB05_07831 [Eragrostis curvula]|uniref:Uncharacterized protein n=1 Tax=Eragrostis curvula TaxID=38414 RepID=A0A5J9WJG1_9POAL|nr:hypothetical protein EJB05_07831 [Eragrostis curvula]